MNEVQLAPPALELKNIEVAFGDAIAVRDINLTVSSGEFVSIVGPSGCGKSTILRCVAGLELPRKGVVSLSCGCGDPDEAAGTSPQIGFVFQRPNLLPWRNVLDNISLPLELSGVGQRVRHDAAREARALVGLSPADERKLPKMLSGGMRMRVSVARAIVTRPRIMLMDEPFAAVDDLLRARLNDELLRLWHQQKWTTLFVTHQVTEAVYLGRRVAVMSPGPGTIVDVIDVPIDYPRAKEWQDTDRFTVFTRAIHRALEAAECVGQPSQD